jgi:hypothetical protein
MVLSYVPSGKIDLGEPSVDVDISKFIFLKDPKNRFVSENFLAPGLTNSSKSRSKPSRITEI